MLFPLYDFNPHSRFPICTILLIAANAVVMLQMSAMRMDGKLETVLQYGFIPERLTLVDQPQPVFVRQVVQDRHGRRIVVNGQVSTDSIEVYSTLITSMFIHSHWLLHLLPNMWMLWIFGNNIEDRLGSFVFLFFYLICGVLAALSHWVSDPNSLLPGYGASGAVFGVMGAYLVTYPLAKVRTLVFIGIPLLLDLPAFIIIGFYAALNFVAGLIIEDRGGLAPSVAFWAHIGGFLAGVILMPLLGVGSAPPGKSWYDEARELFEFPSPDREDTKSRDTKP